MEENRGIIENIKLGSEEIVVEGPKTENTSIEDVKKDIEVLKSGMEEIKNIMEENKKVEEEKKEENWWWESTILWSWQWTWSLETFSWILEQDIFMEKYEMEFFDLNFVFYFSVWLVWVMFLLKFWLFRILRNIF